MSRSLATTLFAAILLLTPLAAQDRLKSMPGHDAALRVAREAPAAVTGVVTGVTWVDEGRAFEYDRSGTRYRFDVALGRATEVEPAADRGRVVSGTTVP